MTEFNLAVEETDDLGKNVLICSYTSERNLLASKSFSIHQLITSESTQVKSEILKLEWIFCTSFWDHFATKLTEMTDLINDKCLLKQVLCCSPCPLLVY